MTAANNDNDDLWGPVRTYREVMMEYNRRHPEEPLTFNQVRKTCDRAMKKLKAAADDVLGREENDE